MDIRGHNGTNLTAPFWANFWVGLHTDSSIDLCELNATVGAVWSEDNFGSYKDINPKFRCTQKDSSTTQWWFGAQFKKQFPENEITKLPCQNEGGLQIVPPL